MRLHGYWRSNATFRVRVALNLKGLDYEEVEYDLLEGHQFDPAFLALNPNAAVPALEVGDQSADLAQAVREQLGDLPTELMAPCTLDDGRFASYRRNGTTLRQVTVAWLSQA